jgi:hypothetical protein
MSYSQVRTAEARVWVWHGLHTPGTPAWVPQVADDTRDPHRLCAVSTLCVSPEGQPEVHRVDYVWTGETIPRHRIRNTLYRLWRRVRWGRTRDVESVYVSLVGGRYPWKYELRGIAHDGTTPWTSWCHSSAEVGERNVTRARAPILYPRTWNHSLSFEPEPAASYHAPRPV